MKHPNGIKNVTEARDVDFAKSVGNDTKILVYNHSTGNFEAGTGGGATLTVGVRATILATSPVSTSMAFFSDTLEFAVWDGSAWNVAPLELDSQANAIDMGLLLPLVDNDRSGYSSEYITDKNITNSRILGSAVEESGSVRTVGGVFQIYLEGVWQAVVTNFRFREDATEKYEIEHRPIGFDGYYEIMSGNSDTLSLSGIPLATQYNASMGAYALPPQIIGRTIDL